MSFTSRIAIASCLMLLAFHRVDAQQVESERGRVTSPPAELELDPFYRKYVDAGGFPIVASDKVPDEALLQARRTVLMMTAKRPDLLTVLARNNVRLAVMARSELTTDIPEHSDLKPKEYWDRRARGLGATHARPACSCAEENLLKYADDRYQGEDILVHEFAHTLQEMSIVDVDDTFDEKLKAAYAKATQRGLWKDTYAATNPKEYWAEGVQSWFNVNRESPRADGIHNKINTNHELKTYDPELAELIAEWFAEPAGTE